MGGPTDNETWVIEEGDRIIQKKACSGFDSLTTWERLVYSLWVADYSMRNGGDLETAKDFFCDFQIVACGAAVALSLPETHELFSMDLDSFEEAYLARFEAVCAEVKDADHDVAPNFGTTS